MTRSVGTSPEPITIHSNKFPTLYILYIFNIGHTLRLPKWYPPTALSFRQQGVPKP